jgi:hypothetical protein
MATIPASADEFDSTSLPDSLIDEIEAILTSPETFTSSTPDKDILPLLSRIRDCEKYNDDVRVDRVQRWCGQLDDASRTAFARETITSFLEEVQSWPEWNWKANEEDVERIKIRVKQIKNTLNELPIEWLKRRVTGTNPPSFLSPIKTRH